MGRGMGLCDGREEGFLFRGIDGRWARERFAGFRIVRPDSQDALIVASGTSYQTLLHIKAGNLVQGLDHLRIDGEDFLVNRNGRNVEIFLGIEVSDLEIDLDRLLRLAFLQVEITHLQVETLVFRAGLDELEIFLDRFLGLALQDVLLCIP
jgi:hypothetical protein